MTIMLLIQLALLVLGFRLQHQSGADSVLAQHRNMAPLYLSLIALEWGLVAAVRAGIHKKGISLWEVVGGRWSSWKDVARDVALCIPFLVLWDGAAWLMHRLLGPDQAKSINSLLPQSAVEIVLWIAVSISAGICEEITFRGYFQKQFAAYTGSIFAGVLLQGIVFGLGHAYQGVKQVIIISVLGIIYGWFAAWRKSLRPAMIAHAWTDIYSGYLSTLFR
ncbi:MAG TPA: CPBP family intramembrane glutamic endopeptidase [Terriglobales bacterium]|nr:CPBP family intramembrane glutamic endopeptidase [Terriglobales bacterium]